MEMKDTTKSALIRKGNELFNQRDIDGAYRCYLTASYFSGIEKIADYYNFEKNNVVKAMHLYKFILKEDSNLGGNIRAKQKLDKISESVVKVVRKWLNDDKTYNSDSKTNKLQTSAKNELISNNYKKNSLEDIINADINLKNMLMKDNKDSKSNTAINNTIENNNISFYSKAANIKKPVFEKIYKNKNNKK